MPQGSVADAVRIACPDDFHPVPDMGHLFAVSRDGRVWSYRTRRELKFFTNRAGYQVFATKLKGRKGTPRLFRVHRLVAETFVPNPESKPIVHHRDHDRANNRASNLLWVTHAENTRYAQLAGRLRALAGEDQPNAVLTDEAVRWARRVYQRGHGRYGCRALADRLGVHHTTMSRVLSGRNWSHVQ